MSGGGIVCDYVFVLIYFYIADFPLIGGCYDWSPIFEGLTRQGSSCCVVIHSHIGRKRVISILHLHVGKYRYVRDSCFFSRARSKLNNYELLNPSWDGTRRPSLLPWPKLNFSHLLVFSSACLSVLFVSARPLSEEGHLFFCRLLLKGLAVIPRVNPRRKK